MTALQGVAIIVTQGFPITNLGKRFEWIGGAMIGQVPFIVILFFFVMLVCGFGLRLPAGSGASPTRSAVTRTRRTWPASP